MTKEDYEQIKKDAADNYEGDIEKALAAHLYTPGTVAKCGGEVPPHADKKKLGLLKGQFSKHAQNAAKPATRKKGK